MARPLTGFRLPNHHTGSPIQATKPVGVFGASTGMQVPLGQRDVDSAQQQIPPVKALGSEYVAVRYRSRSAAPDEAVPFLRERLPAVPKVEAARVRGAAAG